MKTIDFYTTVIDNYGDAGFSFHLAVCLLYSFPNIKIRYFCDDQTLFLKLKGTIHLPNIEYFDNKEITKIQPSSIIYNFFDRKIDFEYLHKYSNNIELINFSYFLMHRGVNNLHNTKYQSKNVSVTHYIPSLLPNSGGIIINPYLQDFKKNIEKKGNFQAKQEFFPHLSQQQYQKKWISVFCYKETFEEIKHEFQKYPEILFFVFDHFFSGKNIIQMPFLNMIEYYKFLYVCDKNIVRGENSLVESILSTKPFLWDIYKESNGAHTEKIHDFSKYGESIFGNKIKKYLTIFSGINLDEEKGKYLREFINTDADFGWLETFEKINLENNLLKNLEKLH